MAKDNPETNPITIKLKTTSHVAELFSWVPLPYFSPPGCPFPIKSLALPARISSDNSFLNVSQEPSFGPWKGSPFLQQYYLSKIQKGLNSEIHLTPKILDKGLRPVIKRFLPGFHFFTVHPLVTQYLALFCRSQLKLLSPLPLFARALPCLSGLLLFSH